MRCTQLQCDFHSHQSPSKQRSILTLDTLAWRKFDPRFFTTVDVAHTGNPRVYYPSNAGMVCFGAVDLSGPDSEA